MIGSILLLLAFCIIYIFIIEIFTVLFRLTGLTEEKAKFQVISLLTACGFTTSQSEAITISKRRRKLASITMIFGYIFSLIIVSVIVNIFLDMSKSEVNTFMGVSVTLVSVFLVVFALTKSKTAKVHFDSLINKVYIRLISKKSNNIFILDVYSHKAMINVHVQVLPDEFADKPLKDTGLKSEHSIQVLIIKRGGSVLENINGDTILLPGDDIVLFGEEKEITRLFSNYYLSE